MIMLAGREAGGLLRSGWVFRMQSHVNCSRALTARVAAMADEIERLEMTAITCMEHAESLRHRIGRLEETVADALEAEPAAPGMAAAIQPAGGHGKGDAALTMGPVSNARKPLAPIRVPIQFKRLPDIGHLVSTMLYAASAALVGTLLSFAL